MVSLFIPSSGMMIPISSNEEGVAIQKENKVNGLYIWVITSNNNENENG